MKPNPSNGIVLLCDSETLANRIRGLMEVRWQRAVKVDYDAPFVKIRWEANSDPVKENIKVHRIKDWLMAIINQQINIINFRLSADYVMHDTLRYALERTDVTFSYCGNCYTVYFIGTLETFKKTLSIQLRENYHLLDIIDFEFPSMI